MAKCKSTDKTSQEVTDKEVDTDRASDQPDAAEQTAKDLDTVAEAVEAVEVYAPEADASKSDIDPKDTDNMAEDAVTDDVIEQAEPGKDAPAGNQTDAPQDSESVTSESDAASEETPPADDHLTEEEAEKLIEEAETVEDHATATDPVVEPETLPVAPQVIKETTIERKGGFVPMLLGGAAAAILGYGVAAYSSQAVWPFDAAEDTAFEDELRAVLTTQDGALSDLGSRIATLEAVEPPTIDLSPVEGQIAAVQTTASELSARLDEIVARIDTLERQPLETVVSEEAIAAYERALDDLKAEVEAQRAEVAQMAQEAVAAEGNAEEKAQLAASRAALADITAALDTGAGFAGAIAVLSANGVDVPGALAGNSENGVPTLSLLRETFPDVARAALRDARSADTAGAEGVSRISTFFANQLGARSVAPKEGDSADAVLSRAEAAVRAGDLDMALSELSALPEAAQSAVSDWQASAQKRLEAKTAADGLVQQLLQE